MGYSEVNKMINNIMRERHRNQLFRIEKKVTTLNQEIKKTNTIKNILGIIGIIYSTITIISKLKNKNNN